MKPKNRKHLFVFAAAMLSFVLPFFDISCAPNNDLTNKGHVTGVQLVLGQPGTFKDDKDRIQAEETLKSPDSASVAARRWHRLAGITRAAFALLLVASLLVFFKAPLANVFAFLLNVGALILLFLITGYEGQLGDEFLYLHLEYGWGLAFAFTAIGTLWSFIAALFDLAGKKVGLWILLGLAAAAALFVGGRAAYAEARRQTVHTNIRDTGNDPVCQYANQNGYRVVFHPSAEQLVRENNPPIVLLYKGVGGFFDCHNYATNDESLRVFLLWRYNTSILEEYEPSISIHGMSPDLMRGSEKTLP